MEYLHMVDPEDFFRVIMEASKCYLIEAFGFIFNVY